MPEQVSGAGVTTGAGELLCVAEAEGALPLAHPASATIAAAPIISVFSFLLPLPSNYAAPTTKRGQTVAGAAAYVLCHWPACPADLLRACTSLSHRPPAEPANRVLMNLGKGRSRWAEPAASSSRSQVGAMSTSGPAPVPARTTPASCGHAPAHPASPPTAAKLSVPSPNLIMKPGTTPTDSHRIPDATLIRRSVIHLRQRGSVMLCSISDQRSQRACAAFVVRVEALGGVVLEPVWLGNQKQHRVRCAEGHDCSPRPNDVQQGGGICLKCGRANRVNPRSAPAWAEFKALVAAQGGEVLEPEWLGNNKPHRVRCSEGHACSPWPASIQRGQGICRKCGYTNKINPRSAPAEAAFGARLIELGAVLLETEWLGNGTRHRARCVHGHDCYPLPASVQQGRGICRACSGRDPAVAEATFVARLEELEATPLYTEWLGSGEPHKARCAQGHICNPIPDTVKQGGGVCTVCVGHDPATSWAKFKTRLEELGATPLEPEWLGTHTPHRVRCAEGHLCWPRPGSVLRGQGVCRTCAGNDPVVARANFKTKLAELGAVLLETEWLGSGTPHRARCAGGHDCSPRPSDVQKRGAGICRTCAYLNQDVFYVMASPAGLKFGITSGNPNGRLGKHRRDGYTRTARLFTDLPPGTAIALETRLKRDLPKAGYLPDLGTTEYFGIEALPLVLGIVDSFLDDYLNGRGSVMGKRNKRARPEFRPGWMPPVLQPFPSATTSTQPGGTSPASPRQPSPAPLSPAPPPAAASITPERSQGQGRPQAARRVALTLASTGAH